MAKKCGSESMGKAFYKALTKHEAKEDKSEKDDDVKSKRKSKKRKK